jgi:hypothetical protein
MAGPVDGEKLSKEFMGMYHEKQIGGLCAVHCMNNLVQGPVFDEIEVNDSLVSRIKSWQRTVPRVCWRSRADCSLGHRGGPASRAAHFMSAVPARTRWAPTREVDSNDASVR